MMFGAQIPGRWGSVIAAVAVWADLQSRAADAASAPVDFSRQVLPVLSENCFSCHGPDDQQRKAKLRLDLLEGAVRTNAAGEAAVVPGDVARSQLVARVLTEDEDDLMPPPKSGKKLGPQQKELLKRWVAEGGRYEKHWSFVAPARPALPAVRHRSWVRNEIDRFVMARLEAEGLDRAPEADRPTLARRLALDLTGLPPTPAEVDAFVADRGPGAYERLVDRWLGSPRYGENMARYWMDAARYADSHGFHIDAERHMWKWRDWVIDAFNRNMPFDQFTREQLAGDLLPEATTDQKIASGYMRSNMTTGEGGAIEEEYLAKYTFDRTETTGTVWMGLTLTCARCHSHKYDPMTQREYYGLYAFFNNLDEPVMDGNRPNPDPFLRLPTEGQNARLAWLKEQVEAGEVKLDTVDPRLDADQEVWVQEQRARLAGGISALKPESASSALTNGAVLKVLDDGSVLAGGPSLDDERYGVSARLVAGRLAALRLEVLPAEADPQMASGRGENGVFRLTGVEAEVVTPGAGGGAGTTNAVKFGAAFASDWDRDEDAGRVIDDSEETGWQVGTNGVGRPQSALFVLREPLDVTDGAELRVQLKFSGKGHASLGHYRLATVTGAAAVAALIPAKPPVWKVLGPFKAPDPATGLATVYEPEERLDFGKAYPGVREEIRWQDRADLVDGQRHLFVNELHGVHGVYYLHRVLRLEADRRVEFSVRADDVFKLLVDGREVARRDAMEKPGDGPVRIAMDLKAGEHTLLLKVANLQGACRLAFNQDLDGLDVLPAAVAGRLLVAERVEGRNLAAVRNYFRKVASPEWKQRMQQVALWREERQEIDAEVVTTMVAKERAERRETRVLLRGEYDKPGDVVAAGVPAVLPALPAGAPTNRLGFAQWLLDPAHPLTARVAVNRLWQQFFGVGLVKTSEDFGVQGERPSHPELLDWLATEYIQSGWDTKRLQRLIVTSATYRQASHWRPELAVRDPENRLLARGPRFRADAEVLRDTALAASGLLVERLGGKSVKPYEPSGLWEAVSFNNSQKYVQDRGEGNYRRSLYTNWKRQSPPPNMLLLDAPTREYCVVRRPRTNTPLQALDLLNDPQFVEIARAFAQRVLLEGGSRVDDRIAYAFRLATARRPDRRELRLLRGLLAAQLEVYRRDPAAAAKLLEVGAWQARADLDRAELAAWATLTSLLLNLDETLTKS